MAKRSQIKNKKSANNMATRRKNTVKSEPLLGGISLKTGLVSFGLVLITIGTYILFETNYQSSEELMPIRFVEIEGDLKHLTREQIIEQLPNISDAEVSSLPDTGYVGFFSSDLSLMEQRLEAISWVQKAELRRIWPDRIHIKITEQKAIAYWNGNALINQYGEIFRPETIEALKQLPSLNGPDEELQRLLQTFKELQQLFSAVELQLAQLNLNHRYSWSMKLANGIQLQIGREHLLERVERFIMLYPLLQTESDLPINKVDLRYDTGLAVTRLEASDRHASL